MDRPTNILITVHCPDYQFTERYILDENQAPMKKLIEDYERENKNYGSEPIIVKGKDDGLWWNDDLTFMLDRMQDYLSNVTSEEDLEPTPEIGETWRWPKHLNSFYRELTEKIKNGCRKEDFPVAMKEGEFKLMAILDYDDVGEGKGVID